MATALRTGIRAVMVVGTLPLRSSENPDSLTLVNNRSAVLNSVPTGPVKRMFPRRSRPRQGSDAESDSLAQLS